MPSIQTRVSPHPWKRDYRALLVAEGLAMAAFGTSMPVIPLYLQDLGVGGPVEAAWWAGLIQSSAAIALAIFAPLWGSMADRHGKRLMLLRALFAGCITVGLMCLIASPWQLLALRILQGVFTGTIAAATVLMTGIVPVEFAGIALGMLTTSVFIGNSVGPLFGGVIADLFGRRMTFLATAVLLLAACFILMRFVREPPAPAMVNETTRRKASFLPDLSPLRDIPALAGILAVGFAVQCAGSIVYPLLPLVVQHLSEPGALVASTTGIILATGGIAGAISAMLAGRLGVKWGYVRVLQICVTGAFVFSLPQAFVTTPIQLLILRCLSSLFIGGAMPAVSALIAQRVPKGRQGGVYGLSSSLSSGGMTLGPVVGSATAALAGLNSVFFASTITLALTGLGIFWGWKRYRRPAASDPQNQAVPIPPASPEQGD